MKMKNTTLTFATLVFATMAGSSIARTWTSADGKNTFEAEFVSATETLVTVDREEKQITFDISKLSADDQTFVKKAAERAIAIEGSSKFRSGAVPKGIADKLKKVAGDQLASAPLDEVIPEYYFLAYSASW